VLNVLQVFVVSNFKRSKRLHLSLCSLSFWWSLVCWRGLFFCLCIPFEYAFLKFLQILWAHMRCSFLLQKQKHVCFVVVATSRLLGCWRLQELIWVVHSSCKSKNMFVLLLLPQVNYFVAKDYLAAIDYLATKNYLIVFEDIVAFVK